jgi:hypothetical protein
MPLPLIFISVVMAASLACLFVGDRFGVLRRFSVWAKELGPLRRIALSVLNACALFLLAYGLLQSYAKSGRVLSIVSATTEMVKFEVQDPDLATIPVRKMRVEAPDDFPKKGGCKSGLFKPVLGAVVTYTRMGYGPIQIEVAPKEGAAPRDSGTLLESGVDGEKFAGEVFFTPDATCVDPTSGAEAKFIIAGNYILGTCGAPRGALDPPYPLYGHVTVGSEFHGTPSHHEIQPYLLSGTLKVSAWSVSFLGMFDEALYKQSEFDLPVGSRLDTYRGESAPADSDYWWGTCYCDPQRPALTVEAVTPTPKLALFRPFVKTPDIIQVTATARIFEDPNLIKAYRLIGLLIGTVTLMNWIFGHLDTIHKHAKGQESRQGEKILPVDAALPATAHADEGNVEKPEK